jgi:hypothetical protein
MSRRNPSKPIAITIELRGGPEAWVKVCGRGAWRCYPGYVSLIDVVREINNL